MSLSCEKESIEAVAPVITVIIPNMIHLKLSLESFKELDNIVLKEVADYINKILLESEN